MEREYDYLIVGTGLLGATAAFLLRQRGFRVAMLDKRDHIGGNVHTRQVRGIHVHHYGAHIFHTSNPQVWEFVNRFATFNRFTNMPVANYKGRLFNLPFNMNTFHQMWGVTTPQEAMDKIAEQRAAAHISEPRNLEEQAISLIGRDLYETLVKGYTEKQWGRKCADLPAFIIKRLPVRLTFDNNYFDDTFQGVPEEGYTAMIERMTEGCDVTLGTDFLAHREEWEAKAGRIIYTGEIDRYYDYRFGHLQYRTLRFETELLEGVDNYQGVAVMNYTDAETPFTRVIEHKHFAFGTQPDTVISREYSKEWTPGDEPYYPVNDTRNAELYARYKALADAQHKVIFAGRLAEYKYYDMHKIIERAFEVVEKIKK